MSCCSVYGPQVLAALMQCSPSQLPLNDDDFDEPGLATLPASLGSSAALGQAALSSLVRLVQTCPGVPRRSPPMRRPPTDADF